MLLHIIIAGNVQGVGFRHFTKKTADEMKIKGWVRNNPDGTVEVLAEADKNTLKNFIEKIKQGPPLSKVIDIKYKFVDKNGGFKEFEIQY